MQNALQLAVLLCFRSYIFYLAIQLAITVASNIEISHAAKRMFGFLGHVRGLPPPNERREIWKNVKAMFINGSAMSPSPAPTICLSRLLM